MIDEKALTRAEYDKLPPRAQGYASYMQAAWNAEVPEDCPYQRGTDEQEEWSFGNGCAAIDAQEVES